jgi:hypothetical protein
MNFRHARGSIVFGGFGDSHPPRSHFPQLSVMTGRLANSLRRITSVWDPIQALGGLGFFAILALALWCEWRAVRWLATFL